MINVLNMLRYICIKICNRNKRYIIYIFIQLKNIQANTRHFFNKKRNKKKKYFFVQNFIFEKINFENFLNKQAKLINF